MYFEEFDKFIAVDFSVDQWSDHSMDIATSIVKDFTADDWQKLLEVLGRRDGTWREKLAQSLGEVRSDAAFHCLCLLLDTADTEVFVAAADSLREFDSLASAPLDIEELKQRYAALESKDSIDELVVADFFRRF